MSDNLTLGEILASALVGTPPEQTTLERACWGDVEALRCLANSAYAAIEAPAASRPLAYIEAITFQRLAAAQGDNTDNRTLVFLLSDFARFWRANGNKELETQFEAEALMLAESIADEGDDEVADMVIASADAIPAAVYERVQQLRSEQEGMTE